jgi:hypothetical protein
MAAAATIHALTSPKKVLDKQALFSYTVYNQVLFH